MEEYEDNRAFLYKMGGRLAASFGRMVASYLLLAVLLARKLGGLDNGA